MPTSPTSPTSPTPPAASAAPDSKTHLHLFGAPRVLSAGRAVALPVRKTVALLVYLALQGPASRATLAALLWPGLDEATARRNLRHALHRLRAAGLEALLHIEGEQVSLLALGDDLQAFDQALAAGRLAEATALRNAPLCDGLELADAPAFNDWLQAQRERFARRWRSAMAELAQQQAQADELGPAWATQQRLVDDDVLQEPACQALMRLHLARGDAAAALRAYRRLQQALHDELGLAPAPATQALALEIRRAQDGVDRSGGLAGDAARQAAPGGRLASAPQQAATGLLASAPIARTGVAAVAGVAGVAGVGGVAGVAGIGGVAGGTALAGESPPASKARSPAPGLPATIPFVARGAAQAQIEAAWARGQRVYLHGVAGAGKTRLACELAAARGPWLRVACEPQDAELPYSSIVRLLRAAQQAAADVVLPEWVRRELAQLMPELGAPPDSQATDEARLRLLAAVAECWRLLVHDNFSAVVLDDWHWGDSASVEFWAGLDDPGPSPARAAPVAWIISHRSAQLPTAALQRMRADVDSGRGLALALAGMDAGEVLALTQALSGAGGAQLFSQRLHQATEGNPFFLLETLRHLFAQGLLLADSQGWSTPFDDLTRDYAELPVPASVHAAVLSRLRALGEAVQQPLELACLCHGVIDAGLLAGAGGMDEAMVIAALEHAQAAQLLHELPVQGQGAGWRFAHDLVRQALQRSLSSARRRLLHERLAQQLERSAAEPALVAAQWEAAQRPGAAVRWRIAAAEAALRVHALPEALAHYGQALAHYGQALAHCGLSLAHGPARLDAAGAAAPRGSARTHITHPPAHPPTLTETLTATPTATPTPALTAASASTAACIHLACARLHARRSDRDAADAALAAAVEAAAQAAAHPAQSPGAVDAADSAPSVLHIQLVQAEYLVETGRSAPAAALLDALAPELARATAPLRARAFGVAGGLQVREGRHNEAQATLQQAADLLELVPEARPQLAALLLEMMRLSHRRGDIAQWGRLAQRAVTLHQALHAPQGQALALAQLGSYHLEAGDRAAGLAATEQARQLAQRCGLVQAQREAIVILVEDAFSAGDIGRAIALLDEGQALAPVFELRQTELNFLAARCYAHQMRGELAPARAAAEQLLAATAQLTEPMLKIAYLLIVVELHLLTGNSPAARPLLAQAQALGDSLRASAEGNIFDLRQISLQAWLALNEGRATDALALLPASATLAADPRDRFEIAWIGGAAARAVGELAQARQRLNTVGLGDEVGGGLLALWLEQCLRLAVQCGRADPVAADKAREQLASRQVPPLLVPQLQAALDAAADLAG